MFLSFWNVIGDVYVINGCLAYQVWNCKVIEIISVTIAGFFYFYLCSFLLNMNFHDDEAYPRTL